MRKLSILIPLCLLLTGFVFSQVDHSVIRWGYDAGDGLGSVLRSWLWVGPDGTLNLQPAKQGAGARMILYPHSSGPDIGANSEYVLYGYSDQAAGRPEKNFERFSLTQMNDNERMIRFSMEAGGSGKFRSMEFCFDTFTPELAYCPLRITPDLGVLVCNLQGTCTRIGG